MKHAHYLFWLSLALLLPGCQLQDSYSGKIIVNGSQELARGETLQGDLILFGGTFTQQPHSTITGSVHVVGGLAELGGAVHGNLTLIDGSVQLLPGAELQGDLTAVGGELVISPTARISGALNRSRMAGQAELTPEPSGSAAGEWLRLLFEIPPLVLVGYLAARFYPRQINIVQTALTRYPMVCAASGLLASVAGLSLAVLMAYTVVLIPVSVLLLGCMLLAATFGVVPAGLQFGRLILNRFQIRHQQPQAAMLGMGLLGLLAYGLRQVPLIGDGLALSLLLAAFGAVLLTQFGGRSYAPATYDQGLTGG